jgi:hypothetical protein
MEKALVAPQTKANRKCGPGSLKLLLFAFFVVWQEIKSRDNVIPSMNA